MKLILNLTLLTIVIMITVTTTLTTAKSQEDIDTLFKKGLEAIIRYEYDEAIQYFDKVLEIDPKNVDALNNKGVSLGNLHKYDEAIQYFDKVLEIDPKNVEALNNKAAALIKLAKYDDAIQYFDKVLEIDPKNAIALSNKKIVLNRDVSYSVTHENKDRLSVFVQIQIRNSAGQLVGYIESDRVRIPDLELLYIILDTTTVGKSTFIQNGQSFVRNEISTVGEYDEEDTVISKTGYVQGDTWLFYADHDGYPLVKGDQTIILWTIIRPNL